MTAQTPPNIYGRRWGRGLRPWLLMLKLSCVAALLGGLITLLVLVLLPAPPPTPDQWRHQADLVHRGFIHVVIPACTGAILAGLLLAASIWRVMIRMHWFVTKMVLVWLGFPLLHLFLRGRVLALRAATAADPPNVASPTALRAQLLAGTVAAVAVVLALMALGRLKPRLGQRR